MLDSGAHGSTLGGAWLKRGESPQLGSSRVRFSTPGGYYWAGARLLNSRSLKIEPMCLPIPRATMVSHLFSSFYGSLGGKSKGIVNIRFWTRYSTATDTRGKGLRVSSI